MAALQDRWYNSLVTGLGLSPSLFQLSQPTTPIPASDPGLWSYQDVLPPESLTFNRSFGGDKFFDVYAAVVQQLQCSTQLEAVIGTAAYQAWTEYLDSLPPPPPKSSQLPALFRTWATNGDYPDIAQKGASALMQINLFNGQKDAVLPYLVPNAPPAPFRGTYASMAATVAKALGTCLSFDSSTVSGDVSGTWTAGADFGIQGLWSGSNSDSRLARVFASGRVTVALQLAHFTQWVSTPGDWYSSSLLNSAYNNRGTPPWPASADPDWEETFGANGTMLYCLAALLVGDGITATVTSEAAYGKEDQRAIAAQAASGLWPFYAATSDGLVSNSVSFDGGVSMTIKTVIKGGNPAVLGGNVLSIAAYLGH